MANTLTGINITSLTLYVSQDMTVERTQYFKHVFAGSERIATKRGFGFMVMPSPPGQGDPNDTVALPFVPIIATQQAGPSFGFADRPKAWSQYLSSIGECASGVASFNLLGAMQFTGAYNTQFSINTSRKPTIFLPS